MEGKGAGGGRAKGLRKRAETVHARPPTAAAPRRLLAVHPLHLSALGEAPSQGGDDSVCVCVRVCAPECVSSPSPLPLARLHLEHIVVVVQEALHLIAQRLAAHGKPLVPRLQLAHAL